MINFNHKFCQIALTLMSLIVLVSSLYFQYVETMEPCPLCLMQRFCVLSLFIFCFLSAVIRHLKIEKLLTCLQVFFAASGLFFAVRQLWLQSLPTDQAPACMPGLDVLIHYFPWQDVLRSLIWGSGDCAEVSWQWLGLTMPAWSALYFLAVLLTSIAIFCFLPKQLSRP